jgi:hypothetical protein
MKAAEVRQYRIAGGIATWPIPIVSSTLALGALGLDTLELALTIALMGFVAQTLWLGGVVETSSRGITRGFLLNSRFLGRTTVIRWDAIARVHTEWRHPGDDTALVTIVEDREGRTIRFSTTMGLHEYWACLANVAARVPLRARSGLTEAILADGLPGRRSMLAAAATAGALALVVVVVVGVHYIWAQGRSSFARYLEQSTAAPESESAGPSAITPAR